VKQFVRGLVPASVSAPAVRFETEPGHQMQADPALRLRERLQLRRLDDQTFGWHLVSRRVHRAFATSRSPRAAAALAACLSGWRPTCRIVATKGTQKLPFRSPMKRSTLPLVWMRTVVLERNTYGRGVHRFPPGFLDYARHAGWSGAWVRFKLPATPRPGSDPRCR
jgi:hypothetical protein